MPRVSRRRTWALAVALVALMLGAVLGATWLQRQILFPRAMLRAGSIPAIAGMERIFVESPQGPVEAWLLPGQGVTASNPGPAVLFAHGNGELIDDWPAELEPYRRFGVSVVLAEYRGYGRSAGSPSEAAITADLEALHAKLGAHGLIDPKRLVYHGRSLGGGAVCTLLRRHPPSALVLESTFTSVADVARGMGVPSFLIKDRFHSLDAVQGYAGPVLVLHGRSDGVVPVEHGQRLAAASPQAELSLYDSGHNDLPRGAEYWRRVEGLLRRGGVLTR